MKKNFKRKKRQLQWLHNWLNIIYYCFWEIIHLKDWDQFLDSCQNQPNNTHLAQEPGLWAIHTFHPRYVAPSHVPSLSGVFSYTFHSYVVTLQGYMPSIRNEKNPFLSPDPSRGVFFPARPDLPLCCHQRLPRAHLSGLTMDLQASFLSTQPPSHTPCFQVRLSTKSRDLFKFSQICYFILKWWSLATAFSFLSCLVN